MHQDKDRGSQWLFAHFGHAMLKLAGVENIIECRTVKGELVAPRRYPDGLMEVSLKDQAARRLYLVEVESHPSPDADRQMFEDLTVIVADRRELPEAIVIVLRPKGNATATGTYKTASKDGTTRMEGSWRIVNLWDLKAADLFAENDVGLIPWISLTQFEVQPEELLRECRDRIEQQAPAERKAGLLAVTQIMAGLAQMEKKIMSIIGGTPALLDSPYLREVLQEFEERVTRRVTEKVEKEAKLAARVESILEVLSVRFNQVPSDISDSVRSLNDDAKLSELHRWAAVCSDLESFRARL